MNNGEQFFNTTAGAGGYSIDRSVRFNSADSAHLSRTPASAGNRKTWTWAGWVKRTKLGGTYQTLFSAYSANGESTNLTFAFKPDDTLLVDYGSSTWRTTSAVYRDTAAWMHICLTADTPQATASNRMKLYVNGSEVTAFSTNNAVTQNVDLAINSTFAHGIGTLGGIYLLDGYLADIHFIDGQALDPTDFGEFDATTGVWNPKAYTGTYGTNGFHLPFSDNSTAAALGTDTSGNGNTWTVNNLKAGPTTVSNSWSAYFDGSGDYITVADNTALDMESSDFAIEGWLRPTGNLSASRAIFSKRANSSTVGGVLLYMASTGLAPSLLVDTGGSWGINFASSQSFVANQWNHFAVVRSGSTFTVYINGVSGGSATSGNTIPNNTSAFAIGAMGADGSGAIDASYISNFRVVKGTAVYTGTFTPPTVPLTAITNTSLLTLQSSTFIDNGPSGFTVTAVGNTRVSVESPFEEFSDTDSFVDSPTNGTQTDTGVGGEVVGNYATLNPLVFTAPTLSNGNLDVTGSGSSWASAFGTIQMPGTGKWYWETTVSTATCIVGIAKAPPSSNTFLGAWADSYGWYGGVGNKVQGPSNTQTSYASFTTNDVIGTALDLDAGTITFYKNGVSQGTAFSGLSGSFFPVFSAYGAGVSPHNFGQRPFAYSAPSGFKALCTANLPAPTIEKGSDYFDTKLYTGNGSTQTISGLDFSPDFVWTKPRSTTNDHCLLDVIRGVGVRLFSNSTSAELTQATSLTSFNSDGFSLGSHTSMNQNSTTYAAWCWDAGSSTVTNNDGSISSQVRANASSGFSVVGGPGNTYFGGTLGHGLGVAPEFILAKDRDSSAQWYVYHKSLTTPNNYHLILNSTSSEVNFGSNLWNVTSTTFASNQGVTGRRGIYFCFAPVAGYSAFGSYTGNGSADGPFVYTGFRPRWVLVKNTVGTNNWQILDSARNASNVVDKYLQPNTSNAESSSSVLDIVSNGFKIRDNLSNWNGSTNPIIYAAFAENPFSLARAR